MPKGFFMVMLSWYNCSRYRGVLKCQNIELSLYNAHLIFIHKPYEAYNAHLILIHKPYEAPTRPIGPRICI